jgi:hypothetical protein
MRAIALILAGAIVILPVGATTPVEDEQELAGECKVVFVDGQADHCVIVIPGTDTPVSLPSRL